jgi:hypothetical protein
MFQDSFSEGRVYWGRLVMILAMAVSLAYLASQI